MKTNINFLSYLAQIFLEWKMFQKEICRGNQNTYFVFDNIVFRKPYHFEIMWKNTIEPDRSQKTLRNMRIASWIPKATNTHLIYVILIDFPLQQWLF